MADMTIAHTILQQLGGGRFTLFTGAKNLLAGPNFLKFQMPRNPMGVKWMKITLTPADLYLIETFKFTKGEVVLIDSCDDVFAEDLQTVFTKMTGFHTNL